MDKSGRKLFNFRPVFFVAVFLCLGILFAYFLVVCDVSAWWGVSLFPVLGASFFLCKDGAGIKRTAFACLSLALAFLVGVGIFILQIASFVKVGNYDGDGVVVGTVVDKVDYGGQTMLVLDDLHINGNQEDGRMKAYFSTDDGNEITLCDEVVVEGYIQTQTALTDGYGFRADSISDGVRFSLEKGASCIKGDENFNLFLFVRQRVETALYAGMDETSAGVCMAVLTGNRTGIDRTLMSNMQYGGIAHIFAVSGLHVGALYAFCLLLFSKTPLRKTPKPARFILLSFLLFFYAGVCGFSASVLRATVLCLTSYFALLLGIADDGLETVGLACIFVLLISPCYLFETGFQLSFLACLGILLLKRRIGQVCDEICFRVGRVFVKEKDTQEKADDEDAPPSLAEGVRRGVVSFLSASLSAQIMTAPVLLTSFGYLSALALFLNCIFVPFIGATFAILLLFVVVSACLPLVCAPIILYLPSVLWAVALLIFELIDFSAFLWTRTLGLGGVLAYYGACVFLTDKWNLSKSLRLGLVLACFSVFVIGVVVI